MITEITKLIDYHDDLIARIDIAFQTLLLPLEKELLNATNKQNIQIKIDSITKNYLFHINKVKKIYDQNLDSVKQLKNKDVMYCQYFSTHYSQDDSFPNGLIVYTDWNLTQRI